MKVVDLSETEEFEETLGKEEGPDEAELLVNELIEKLNQLFETNLRLGE